MTSNRSNSSNTNLLFDEKHSLIAKCFLVLIVSTDDYSMFKSYFLREEESTLHGRFKFYFKIYWQLSSREDEAHDTGGLITPCLSLKKMCTV